MKPIVLFLVAAAAFGATEGDVALESAKTGIAKHADYAPSYNALAMAYVQRASETADVSFYGKAEEALRQCLRLDPNLYDGKKTEVLILLGRHEYAKALERSTALNKQTPDDIAVYG